MGKYDKEEETSVKVWVLKWIANELAEANRLKRLGMKFEFSSDMDVDQYNKDLEDQA